MDFSSLIIALPTLVTGLALTELLRRRRKAARSVRAPARVRKEHPAQREPVE
jgi:ABC-type sulfate transport system permease component